MKKQTSLVSFVLAVAVGIVVVLTATVLLVVSTMLSGAITDSVKPFLAMASQVAAKSVAAGLQLDSKDEVAAALGPFADNPLFTYVRVKNKAGAEVFAHRQPGMPALTAGEDHSDGEANGELFGTAVIMAEGGQLGTLTVGMSVADRDAALASARGWLLGIGFGAIVLIVVSIRLLLRWRLERPLKAAATEIRESAAQVLQLSRLVATSSQSLSQGATQQAASLEETSASMEEMASMTRKNAENSQQAAQLMVEVDRVVEGSNTALTDMTQSMASIRESSDKVAKIIKTIDEIAFQTNILALNAAVEAARAGEAGMGFAVVADEVRSLAQRSAQAAKDTASLIEDAIHKSQEGNAKVDVVVKSISEITDSVGKAKGLVSEVSQASQQQTQGIDQVAQSVAQMEQVTQATAANAEESAAAAEQLNSRAEATMAEVAGLEAMVVGTQTRDIARPPLAHQSHAHEARTRPAGRTRPRVERRFPLSPGAALRGSAARAENEIPLAETGTDGRSGTTLGRAGVGI